MAANGEAAETYDVFPESRVDEAPSGASACFGRWRKSDWSERSGVMSAVTRASIQGRLRADDLRPGATREDREMQYLLTVGERAA